MKKLLSVGVIVFVLSTTIAFAQFDDAHKNQSVVHQVKSILAHVKKQWTDQEIIELGYVPGEVVVKFRTDRIDLKTSQGQSKLKEFTNKKSKKEKKYQEKQLLRFANAAVISIDESDDIQKVISELIDSDDVEYISPNYVFTFDATVNDPYFNANYDDDINPNQWSLNNKVTPGNDISVDQAWDLATGGAQKIIAVLDTGVAYDHPDLNTNMWSPSSCVDENNVSISGGCPHHGWDFVNNDNDPSDDNGHGTHVAGIIGAVTNNNEGIAGVNHTASIMAVKIGESYGTVAEAIRGIQFAQNNGADIINASFGGYHGSQYNALHTAVENFVQSGLLVASAGNDKNDNDSTGVFPASFEFDNVLSIAATDQNDQFASTFSNWGNTTVDLAAPGVDIWSTWIQNYTATSIDLNALPLSSPWYVDAVDFNVLKDLDSLFTNSGIYSSNQYQSVTTPSFDLSGNIDPDSASFSFDLWCDTEPQGSKINIPDYLQVSLLKNGVDQGVLEYMSGFSRVNEDVLSVPEIFDSTYLGKSGRIGYVIDPQNFSSNVQFRIDWITDSNDIGGPYKGCILHSFNMRYLNSGESGQSSTAYHAIDGTSMSAPMVSGVASLVWNEHPTLTASEVKQIIMDSGDPVSSLSGKTVSGKRLNAYRAMQLAEQRVNGDVVELIPTIHANPGGGYWNNTSTWAEGVVPGSDDIVEINGTVLLNTNPTVAGVYVTSGATLQSNSYGTQTLTLSGADAHFKNHGTLQDYQSGHIAVVIGGDLENRGSFDPYSASVGGDLFNLSTGTVAVNTSVAGNIENGSSIPATLILNGASVQTIEGTGTFNYLTLANDATIVGDLTLNFSSTVQAGKTLTIGTGNTLTTNVGLFNYGTINGGIIRLSGASQNVYSTGTLNLQELRFANGTTKLFTNVAVTGNLRVDSGAIVQAMNTNAKPAYTLTINGEVLNDGTIQSYYASSSNYGVLNLTVNGTLNNNGSILYNAVASTRVDVNGALNNAGTTTVITYVSGDVDNDGIANLAYYLDGTGDQSLGGSGTFNTVSVQNDVTMVNDIASSSSLTIASGATLDLNGYQFAANGGLYNSGTLTDGDFRFGNTGSQYLGTCGTITQTNLTFAAGTTNVNTNCEWTGDMIVLSGATVQPFYANRILTIHGDLNNAGTIQHSGTKLLTLYVDDTVTNTGTLTATVIN
ncbi:S8 family serine peptidase [Candidatus Peregrinibacteria bacterium]|nr:MAG: S8 family serine peptidase [Candidatus Peregrinibacteria bacterium]